MSEQQQMLPEMVENQDKSTLKQQEVVKEDIRTERFDVRISPELKKTLKELGKKEGKTQPELMEMLFNAYVNLQSLNQDGDVAGELKRSSELSALEKALNQVRTAFLSQIASYQYEVQDAQLDLSNSKAAYEEEIASLNNQLRTQEGLNNSNIEELNRKHALVIREQEDKYENMEIRLTEKVESLEKELSKIEEDLVVSASSLRQERMITSSQASELESLKATVAIKDKDILSLEEELKSFAQIESELSSIKASNKELLEKVADLKVENDKLAQALDTSNKQNQFYSAQLEEVKSDYPYRISMIEKSYEEQLKNLREQCAFYQKQLEKAESQSSSVSANTEK